MTTKRYHLCAEAQEDFSAFLDGELDPDVREALEDHLAECSDCLRQLDGFRRVDVLYGALPPVAAPPGLERRVAERLSGKRFRFGKAPARPGRWLGPVFAAVAVLLVILSVTATVLRTSSQRFEMAREVDVTGTDEASPLDNATTVTEEPLKPGAAQERRPARADGVAVANDLAEPMPDVVASAPPPPDAQGFTAMDVARSTGAAAPEEPAVQDAQQKALVAGETAAPMAAAPLSAPTASAPSPEVSTDNDLGFIPVQQDASDRPAAARRELAQPASPLFTVGELGLVQAGYNGEATTALARDSERFRALAENYPFVARMVDWNDPVIFKVEGTWFRLGAPEPPVD